MGKEDGAAGRLYLCATPIGNLQDVTLRVLDVLSKADLVAAEDTRRTRKLFTRHGIHTPLMSYREENREAAARKIVERIERGECVALVSDAGTPGISDPGEHLVRVCLERDIEIEALPGPNAALTALVLSGLPARRFAFEGFPPRKKGARRKALAELADDTRTLVFYESPARLAETLADIEDVLGDRRVAVARELTKRFEQVMRGSVSDVREQLTGEPKGEVVIVVEGSGGAAPVPMDKALEEVMKLREEGLSLKDAVSRVAAPGSGLSRSQLYNEAVRHRG